MMSRSLLGSKVTDVTGVRDEDYAANLVCILCTRKGVTPKSDEVVLSTFPLDYYLCRSWVKMVGIKELAQMPIKKLNEKLFLCQSHFHPKCFVKKNNSIFLIAEAVPTEELYYRMLPDSALADFAREEYKQQRIEDKLSEEAVKKKDSDTVELYRCIICDGNSKPDQSSLLSRFPIEPEVCRVWVKRLGLEELASMSARELHKTRFLCEAHFDPSCIAPTTKYFRSYSLPDRNLPNPPLDNSLIENYSEIEERAVIRKHQRVLAMTRNPRYYPKRGPSLDECADDPKENLNESSVDLNDIKFAEVESELELLSEDTDYATADGQPHSDAPDEIDSLFSNYAERYRKLSTSNQAMLRSDLEQLIGRYEVKNSAVTILPYKHLVISDTKKPVVIDKPQKIEASVTPVQLPPPFENTPTKPRPLVKRIINIPTAKNQAFSKDTIKRICDPAPALKSDLIFVPGNVRKLKRTNTVPNTTFKLVKVASLTAPEDVMILDSSTGLFKSPSLLKTQSWPSGTARVLHDYAAT